jgi:hypothetical protein
VPKSEIARAAHATWKDCGYAKRDVHRIQYLEGGNMKALIGLAITVLLTLSAPVTANERWSDPGVDQRQERLAHRIEHGWRSGELTPPEYRRLRQEWRDIARDEHHFIADGRLSPRERDHLHARLDHLARAVQIQRRDVDRRYGSYNGPAYSGRHY